MTPDKNLSEKIETPSQSDWTKAQEAKEERERLMEKRTQIRMFLNDH
jgi:hypothetical protein